jgi:uncharacterized protein (TIGR01244 family)
MREEMNLKQITVEIVASQQSKPILKFVFLLFTTATYNPLIAMRKPLSHDEKSRRCAATFFFTMRNLLLRARIMCVNHQPEPPWGWLDSRQHQWSFFMYRQIDSEYAVAGQLQPEDMQALAAAGFKAIIDNRPDGEDAGQPDHATMRAAAEAAGLAFVYIPVGAAFPVERAAYTLKEALPDLPRPMLAYCRSGARSTTIYQIALDID